MAKQFKSEVWQFFDRTNAEACTCHVCKCEVKKPKGNTSNLTRYLERHHQREFQEYNRLTKLFLETEICGSGSVSRSGSKGADRICIWICLKKAGS